MQNPTEIATQELYDLMNELNQILIEVLEIVKETQDPEDN